METCQRVKNTENVAIVLFIRSASWPSLVFADGRLSCDQIDLTLTVKTGTNTNHCRVFYDFSFLEFTNTSPKVWLKI